MEGGNEQRQERQSPRQHQLSDNQTRAQDYE
jgi:hypothetical protein